MGDIEALIEKYDNFQKDICTQEGKIEAFLKSADTLITSKHYASNEIGQKKQKILLRWSNLKDTLINKRKELTEMQKFFVFSNNADEMNNWIREKMKIAQEEKYKD